MSLGQFVKLAVHFQLQFFVARGSNSKKVNKEDSQEWSGTQCYVDRDDDDCERKKPLH